MRSGYVRALRVLRSVLAATGALGLLDRLAARSRGALWIRSWFAIYDVDDLVALDRPWWTFAASDRVEEFLVGRPGARVFEWGSGASTVWLAARSAVVISVEHDAQWARRMRDIVPSNVELVLVEPVAARGTSVAVSHKPGFTDLDFADYVDRIDEVPGELDLVVIDGRAREACLGRALTRLAPGGMVVLDNVERVRYRDALALWTDVRVEWTRGMTPTLPYPTRTALITADRP